MIGKTVCHGCCLPYVRWFKIAQGLHRMDAVCGPLAVLRDQWDTDEPPANVLNRVVDFRRRLHRICAAALKNLGNTQERMKNLFDRKTDHCQCEPLSARRREISAFITPGGSFSNLLWVMFGLCNAPAILTNKVLSELVGCAVYWDDVAFYSSTWSDHVQYLEALLSC